MKRKLLPILLLLILTLIGVGLFACATPKETEDAGEDALPSAAEEKKTVLFLGDSIGEAIAGTAPLTEREDYGYYGILGNVNGFTSYNRAVTGYTTGDLRKFVKREDDGVNMVRSLITSADVIHISIIGNDFLNSNHAQMLIDLSENNYERIVTRQNTAKENLEEIFSTIRSLNPNAVIVMQTLYNPAGEDSPLFNSYARQVLKTKGILPDGYHALMDKMIRAINDVLTEFQADHTTVDEKGKTVLPFELADVYSAFEKVYEEDRARWQEMFALDGVHTHPEGHALVTAVLQEKFAELGFTSPAALHNYKTIKVRQLNRLYGDLAEIKQVRDAIMQAKSFRSVSDAYFDGTRGQVPHYAETPVRDGKHFSESKTFSISLLKAFDYNLTSFLDLDNATIVFDKNGEYTLYAPLSELAKTLVKGAVKLDGGINVDDYFPFDLAHYYFTDAVPGITADDLEGFLAGVKELYGLEMVGLNYDSEAMQALFDRHRDTYELILDDPAIFGKTLALKSTGTYVLNEVKVGEKTCTAIYVNDLIGKGESYMRYTYVKDEETEKESVRMTIDVLQIEVEGVLRED